MRNLAGYAKEKTIKAEEKVTAAQEENRGRFQSIGFSGSERDDSSQ